MLGVRTFFVGLLGGGVVGHVCEEAFSGQLSAFSQRELFAA
jgi:hypothetical protein